MPTSTPSRPAEAGRALSGLLPPEAIRQALEAQGAEASLALPEMAANPGLPRLVHLLGAESLGRALTISPLDLSQALAELGENLAPLERLHSLSVRPHSIGRTLARSLPSFMKGWHEIARRDISQSLREFEALLPESARQGLPRPFPESESEAHTLLALLERLLGAGDDPPLSGELPMGCEVEVPRDLADYPAGGAYVFALFAGLPLGEDELVEFSLPPTFGAAVQVRLIDAVRALRLLPAGRALSLHATCETPEEAAAHPELVQGTGLISFCLAYLYGADRRLGAGQIFKNFRLKRRGISGLKWQRAVGAEYRLVNVCTTTEEPGVLGDPMRAHQASLLLAERLHGALIDHCLGRSGPWAEFRARLEGWIESHGLRELVREHNVTGELATLFAGRRKPELQRQLLDLIGKSVDFRMLPA